MDGGWPQYDNDVQNMLDMFITSEHDHLLQHQHGDEMHGLLGATTNMGNTDEGNALAADKGNNNDGETRSEQRMVKMHAKYHRLFGEQIEQLEAVFQECPYPNAKLRKNLSERLGMSAPQVKFWFQNKRNYSKSKKQLRDTKNLQGENQMLNNENQAIKWVVQNNTCLKCAGVMLQTQDTSEHQRLCTENMRLKEELRHATAYLKEGLRRNGMWPLFTRD
ncbi:homeobox-leucine zipper protein ROC4-like [Hordeum vulgare subsp. vulgare]|uniref:Homeobox domain-containing protein n=1 Tax=Hordeum vulgare subsp. vulgare TaxID=112509 RepID=A0A8I6X577_HORVV|nr:homeobox-leucine zipper protein ROC4-like [Hordeum vulgare subsp. vulgare]